MGRGNSQGVRKVQGSLFEQAGCGIRSVGKKVQGDSDVADGEDETEKAIDGSDQAAAIQLSNNGPSHRCSGASPEREGVNASRNEMPMAAQVHVHSEKLEIQGDRKVNAKSLRAIMESQGYKCAPSGRDLTPENASLDHINPFSRSADHSVDNVHFVTAEINAAKGTMSTGDFIRMCHDVAATHPMPTCRQPTDDRPPVRVKRNWETP